MLWIGVGIAASENMSA